MIRTDILERKQEILAWIEMNQSKNFICIQLGCKPETLNSYLQKMDIVYKGNRGGKGIKFNGNYKTAEEYSKSTCIKSHTMKLKLLKDNIKEHKCERCNLTIWQDVLIPLELHHVDGNHFNNDFENLQLLCPNCHALELNNSGKAVRLKKINM